MSRKSEIYVMTSQGESYILEDFFLREVSIDKLGFDKRLYIKLQGVNNKTEKTEQIKIHLRKSDAETLCEGLNETIRQGLFKDEI